MKENQLYARKALEIDTSLTAEDSIVPDFTTNSPFGNAPVPEPIITTSSDTDTWAILYNGEGYQLRKKV